MNLLVVGLIGLIALLILGIAVAGWFLWRGADEHAKAD